MNARERRDARAVVEAAEQTMADIEDVVRKLEIYTSHLNSLSDEVPGDRNG